MYLPKRRNYLIVFVSLLIAVGLSSISLWLLESPLKRPLFIFEVALIFSLCLVYLAPSSWQFSVKARDRITIFDYSFLTASLTLLLLVLFDSHSIVNQILAIAVCFFLPGYTLLRFIRFRSLHTWIEILVLSMLLSIPISGLIYTVMLIAVPNQERAVILASVYVLISLSLILWNALRRSETNKQPHIYSANVMEAVLLVIILSFIVYIISVTYPQMAYFPGTDIVRHFSAAQVVNIAPDLYNFPYPWFQFQLAQVQVLAKQSIGIFQLSTTYLTLILVFSFYIMVKAYLRGIDRRLPILSTVFFAVFSGFGWVYFLKEKIVQNDLAMHVPLLSRVNEIAYYDLMHPAASELWLWYRPWTLGVALLLVLLYLLKRQDLSKRVYIILFSLSVITLGMIHFSEMLPFVGVIFVLALFSPKIELRLKEGVLSTLIGVSTIALLVIIYGYFFGFPESAPYTYLVGLGAVLLTSYMLIRFVHRPTLRVRIRMMQVPVLLAALIYVGLLIVWLSLKEPFSATQVVELFTLPWVLYPVLSGVCGLLGLVGLVSVVKEYRSHPIVVFSYLFIIGLLITIFVDFLNVRFFFTGYWGRRTLIVPYVGLSVLAALALTKVSQVLSRQTFGQLSAAFMVGIITFCGIGSTIIIPEYWYYRLPNQVITEDVKNVLASGSSSLKANPQVAVWTVSDPSRSEAEFMPASWVEKNLRSQLWSCRYPEMALNLLLYEGSYPPPYVYLHQRDLDILKKDYPDSYIAGHFLPYSPNICKGAEAGIYQAPELTTPRSQSYVALLLPTGYNDSCAFAYDMLSLGGWEYTTYLEADPNPKGEIFIIPYDQPFNLRKLSGKKVIITNTNGYGYYAERMLETDSRLLLSFDESPTDAFFHLSIDYPVQLTHLDATYPFDNKFEFTIDNDAEESNSAVVADDDQVSFWKVIGTGKGNIGVPVLANEAENKVEGSNSLRIEIGEGNYLWPYLVHAFNEPQDWSHYDFMSFYWYGYGDNRRYDLQLSEANSDNFLYTFWDTWEGWRKVIIPLRMDTGTTKTAGIRISKAVSGEPSWSNIKQILIAVDTESKVMTGTWFLDKITLGTGRWLRASLEMHNLSPERLPLTLSIYDGTSYLDIPLAGEGEVTVIPSTQFYFPDGSKAVDFYGEGDAGTIKQEETQESCFLTLSVKLPPDLGDDSASGGESQAMFRVELPSGKPLIADGIVSDKGKLSLGESLPITHFKAKDGFETVAEYVCEGGERTPLAVRGIVDGVEVTYLNAYPLVEHWATESEFGARIYSPAKDLLEHIGLNLPQGTYGDIISYQSKLMFKEAVLNGSVEIVSPSIVFSPLPGDTSIQVESEGTTICYVGLVSAEIESEEKVTLSTASATLVQGKGFYTRLSSGESTISADGENIVLSLELADGQTVNLNVGSHVELRVVGNHEVYLRTPKVSIIGEARFNTAYAYKELEIYPPISGQDLIIDGCVEFSIPLSDTYSMAQDFTWSGSKNREPPVYQRSVGQDFKNTLPWVIILFVFAIFCYMAYQSGKAREGKDSNSLNQKE